MEQIYCPEKWCKFKRIEVKLATVLSQSKRLKLAYELNEEFREIFESHHSVEEGKESLLEWIKKAQEIYSDTLTMLRNHIDGIYNYFLNRTTSGVIVGNQQSSQTD